MNGFGLWPLFHAAEQALQRPGLNLPREAPQTWAWLCELTHHLEHQSAIPLPGLEGWLTDPERWQRLRTVALEMGTGPSVLPPQRAALIMAEHDQYPTERLRQRLPPEARDLPLAQHLRFVVKEMGTVFLEELGDHLRDA